MPTYLIDTSIGADFLRGNQDALDLLERYERDSDAVLIVSILNEAELYFGCRNDEERQKVRSFLTKFHRIHLNRRIMERAGELRALYGRAYACDLVDMLIAATAIEQNAILLTLNLKHFHFIAGLTVRKPYGPSSTP